ncbi:hypothetical protein ACWEQP_25630 [Streptomyces sp. NPDC004044]
MSRSDWRPGEGEAGYGAHRAGQENFCHAFPTLTYGGVDRQDGST